MARPANQTNGGTGYAGNKKYNDWGDKKVHSISYSQHVKNVKKKKQAGAAVGAPGAAPAPAPEDNSLYDYANPLSSDQMKSAVQSAVNTKYDPIEKSYGKQIDYSNQADTNVSDWYGKYQRILTGARDTQQQMASNVAALAPQEQAVPAPTGDQVADQTAQNRVAVNNGYSALNGAMFQQAFQDANARVLQNPADELQAHTEETRRRADIRQALTDMVSERGDYGNDVAMQLRGSERDWADRLSQRANEKDAADAAAAAAMTDAQFEKYKFDRTMKDNSLNRQTQKRIAKLQADAQSNSPSAKKSQAELDYLNEHGYLPPTGPPKTGKNGKKPPTAADRRAERARIEDNREKSGTKFTHVTDAEKDWNYWAANLDEKPDDAKAIAGGDNSTKGIQKSTGPKRAELVKAYLRSKGYSSDEIHLALVPKWGPEEIRLAHRIGIKYIPRERLISSTPISTGTGNPASAQGTGLG
jgi:hypothetical protein